MRRERTRRALAAARYLMDAWQVERAAETLDTLLADGAMGPIAPRLSNSGRPLSRMAASRSRCFESALEHTGDDRVLRARILAHPRSASPSGAAIRTVRSCVLMRLSPSPRSSAILSY